MWEEEGTGIRGRYRRAGRLLRVLGLVDFARRRTAPCIRHCSQDSCVRDAMGGPWLAILLLPPT